MKRRNKSQLRSRQRREKAFPQRRDLRKLVDYWSSTLEYADRDQGKTLPDDDDEFFGKLFGQGTKPAASSGSNQSISKLLSQIKERRFPTPLLERIARLSAPNKREIHRSKVITYCAAKNHKGQFSGDFSLNDSQRHAVHRALSTPDNDFVCVIGPPGTGKTTLLQSVIASLYVNAALKCGQTTPPIVACTGATNQSVQNVIDCFTRADIDDQVLASRWLPAVFSYGSFCISRSRSEQLAKSSSMQTSSYQQELMQGLSFSNMMHTSSYYAEAKAYYLKKAATFFDFEKSPPRSIKAVTTKLRRLLIAEHKRFLADLNTISGMGLVYWFKTVIGSASTISLQAFEKSLPALDEVNRYSMFLLAARYWEGMWLLGFSEGKARIEAARSKDEYLPTDREYWERRAMITPAFVSTLSMLPRFFHRKPGSRVPPIDYLIFDEAGQIPVDLGTALTALARRALIVGDRKQLEPMFSVESPDADRVLAAKSGLLGLANRDSDWTKLEQLGVVASSGSLMKLAENTSRFSDNGKPGAFLREQRRSVPAIVNFCNDLSYQGELIPVRKVKTTGFLPPFYFFDVKSESQQVDSSRVNYEEVYAINIWIETYRHKLLLEYGADDIADIVAVITPHKAQAEAIKSRLGKLYHGIIAGTVNSLQGAERPVVLFSSVYGENYSGKLFFDQNTNMLNVAVSRARDSFIVFGNKKLFDLNGDQPSSVLAQYLFRDYGKALEPHLTGKITPIFGTKIQIDLKDNFPNSLKEHQEILRGVLEQAKERIIIVSPTISAAAIRTDNLSALINRAINRGVRVDIVADYALTSTGDKAEISQEGLSMLRQAGASVHVLRGFDAVHAKRLGADGEIYVTGSFNWLSANRNQRSDYQKYEESTVFYGEIAHRRFFELSLWVDRAIERSKRFGDVDNNSDPSHSAG